MSEIELIKCCKRNDRKAQSLLYERYADGLYRLAFRYVKTEADVEDIVMVAFVKILKSIKDFEYKGEGSLQGWMRKIVINESLMWLRKRFNFNLFEALVTSLQEPDLSVIQNTDAEDVYQFIMQLPIGYRTVFNLHTIEGYNHAEIATMLGIQESTCRSQLYKAKALLKKMITKEGIQYGT